MMMQAKLLAEQLLGVLSELRDEIRLLRHELAQKKTSTGGERNG